MKRITEEDFLIDINIGHFHGFEFSLNNSDFVCPLGYGQKDSKLALKCIEVNKCCIHCGEELNNGVDSLPLHPS